MTNRSRYRTRVFVCVSVNATSYTRTSVSGTNSAYASSQHTYKRSILVCVRHFSDIWQNRFDFLLLSVCLSFGFSRDSVLRDRWRPPMTVKCVKWIGGRIETDEIYVCQSQLKMLRTNLCGSKCHLVRADCVQWTPKFWFKFTYAPPNETNGKHFIIIFRFFSFLCSNYL